MFIYETLPRELVLLMNDSILLQVVIFVKSVQRCIALAQLLKEQNFPAIDIHRAMGQEERLKRYELFKVDSNYNVRD